MLSIHPDALIWNQSYVFLAKIMMGGGTKFLNYVFSQKMLKNMPILGVFFMLLLKQMAETYIILLVLFRKKNIVIISKFVLGGFKFQNLLELVVRLVHKYGLGEKTSIAYLHIHSCYSYYNCYYLQQTYISQK